MAQRRRAQREVGNVTPDLGGAYDFSAISQGAKTASEFFGKLQEKKDMSRINDYMADSQIQMLEATNKWRVENEANPNDPKALQKLNLDYDKITGQYSNEISGLSRGKWVTASGKLKDQFKLQNASWGIKQEVINTENNMNGSIKKNLEVAKGFGLSGDIKGAVANYKNADAGLRAFSDGVIGSEKIKELTEDFESDYMKSFMIGAISNDPNAALELLKTKEVQKSITDTKDIGILIDYAKATIEGNKQIENANDWKSQKEFDSKVATGELDFLEVVDRWNEGKLSTSGLKKYTKLAGGEDPISIETDYVAFNEIYRDIFNPDTDLQQTYEKLNKAFIEEGKLSVQDYGLLVQMINPDYYQAVNKNRFMNASPIEKGLLGAVDMFTKGKANYGFADNDVAKMSKDLSKYAEENPRSNTRDMLVKAKELQSEFIFTKYPGLEWSSTKQLYESNGKFAYLSLDRDGYPVIEEKAEFEAPKQRHLALKNPKPKPKGKDEL